MEKPEYAPNAIGDVMASCWREEPDDRLTFSRLEQVLGEMVDPDVRARFAVANDQYTAMNGFKFNDVNEQPNAQTNPGYMKMCSNDEVSLEEGSSAYMNVPQPAPSKPDRLKMLKKQGVSAYSLPLDRPVLNKSLSFSGGEDYLPMTPVSGSSGTFALSVSEIICEELLEVPIEEIEDLV